MSYWHTKKDIFLNKAKFQLLGFEYKDVFQKEIDLLVCGTILRYCMDQGFIKNKTIRKNLNSIIHASRYIHLKDGTMIIESDYDLKKEKGGVNVDAKFIKKIVQSIDKAIIEKLNIKTNGNSEYLIH